MSRGRTVAYVRVSSVDQNEARQLEGIKDAGIEVDKTFIEKASGKSTDRPQLQRVLEMLWEGDTLVVHSMDRLARSVIDLRKLVDDLVARDVRVQFVKEKLTFRKPTGGHKSHDELMAALMLTMLGGIAEFERGLILERQREGIAAAKLKTGKDKVYRGRKPALSTERAAELRKRAAAGENKAALAREFGISRAALYVYIQNEQQNGGQK